ncbi:hypothetical protein [Methyloceanibacter sp.]|uniref:hypothetical protein n=1 Tax=Methyloceanibacter sp. TaxID=1965321 RepID=UPI002D328476|nr:hypothetical protein [Methyloceanibacter sp.]HZP10667.1 hypothetical protein [Methyloceanibacter sp.]
MSGESVWRRPAPAWFKLVAGAVIFPLLWLGTGLVLGELLKGWVGSPIPIWLLLVAAVIGAVASFLLARRASLPFAMILILLPMLAYVASYYALREIGNTDSTVGQVGEQRAPALPEAVPAPAKPSGAGETYGGGTYLPPEPPQSAPQYHSEAPDAQEGSPAPPAPASGGSLGANNGDSSQAQSEQQAAEIEAKLAAERAKEEAEKQAAAEEAAAKASQEETRGPRSEEGQLPEFPWPPPRASASYVLPDNLLASYHTVGEVTSAILNALEQSGYVERSFFETKPGGVALVTRLERINDDGTPSAAAERWPDIGEQYRSSQSLIDFLEGLFYVDPGHYRVIVFVLQDMPFAQSATSVTATEARAWLTSGANVLPAGIAARPFGGANGGHCTALIYEFASDGSKVHVVDSRLTGKQHLDKAGLLTSLAPAH